MNKEEYINMHLSTKQLFIIKNEYNFHEIYTETILFNLINVYYYGLENIVSSDEEKQNLKELPSYKIYVEFNKNEHLSSYYSDCNVLESYGKDIVPLNLIKLGVTNILITFKKEKSKEINGIINNCGNSTSEDNGISKIQNLIHFGTSVKGVSNIIFKYFYPKYIKSFLHKDIENTKNHKAQWKQGFIRV
ncbi:hypothetical protein MKS88_004743 [Plasmodium brasilianum]|uniref:Uncharacterized protein n=1 Tax=Plasmodium brasilianum TaxID=5824 RepID=A0ACB9Y4W5_PLABR|nr:hypothetical protein MKS88_004743 [Plasmodium brasilianum]